MALISQMGLIEVHKEKVVPGTRSRWRHPPEPQFLHLTIEGRACPVLGPPRPPGPGDSPPPSAPSPQTGRRRGVASHLHAWPRPEAAPPHPAARRRAERPPAPASRPTCLQDPALLSFSRGKKEGLARGGDCPTVTQPTSGSRKTVRFLRSAVFPGDILGSAGRGGALGPRWCSGPQHMRQQILKRIVCKLEIRR